MSEPRYWWHTAIARELARIRSTGIDGYNSTGIASNLHIPASDVARYCLEMVAWGELAEIRPLWDYDAVWVRLDLQDAAERREGARDRFL